MPLLVNSRCRALASDVLPSPGAPLTFGTTAVSGPSLLMLLVVPTAEAGAGAPALATVDFAPGARASAVEASAWAPTPAGWAAALATAAWPRLVSQEVKEFAALAAIDWAIVGVIAAQGSLPPLADAISSPVTRLTRLPVGSVTSQM